MSILIKGMDIPKNCSTCPFYICDGEGWCVVLREYISHPKYCPLVEVKTPHGRLIDADILYGKFAELDAQALEYLVNLDCRLNEERQRWFAILVERSSFKSDVFDAPTVIEAEE